MLTDLAPDPSFRGGVNSEHLSLRTRPHGMRHPPSVRVGDLVCRAIAEARNRPLGYARDTVDRERLLMSEAVEMMPRSITACWQKDAAVSPAAVSPARGGYGG